MALDQLLSVNLKELLAKDYILSEYVGGSAPFRSVVDLLRVNGDSCKVFVGIELGGVVPIQWDSGHFSKEGSRWFAREHGLNIFYLFVD